MTHTIERTLTIDGQTYTITLYAGADSEVVGRTLPETSDSRITDILSYYCLGWLHCSRWVGDQKRAEKIDE